MAGGRSIAPCGKYSCSGGSMIFAIGKEYQPVIWVKTYYLVRYFCPENYMKMKETGARVPRAPPLDPPMSCSLQASGAEKARTTVQLYR